MTRRRHTRQTPDEKELQQLIVAAQSLPGIRELEIVQARHVALDRLAYAHRRMMAGQSVTFGSTDSAVNPLGLP